MKKNNGIKDILFYVLVISALIVVIYMLVQSGKPKSISYSEVLRDFKQEKVVEFSITENKLDYIRTDDSQVHHVLYSVDYFRQDLNDIILAQTEKGIIKKYNFDEGFVPPTWMLVIPYVVLFVVFIGIWYFMMNKVSGGGDKAMNFKRAHPRYSSDDKKKVTFNDVEGAKEEKEELKEIVDFLKSPKRFIEIGARIPKGVLLVGPPGTGKTLLAKAVAGEAGVPFLSISGSDFVELYVGVGASRVRSLFEEAKKVAPSIIFIDEIDAVGRHRGAGMGGGHDEREQTLNQLLVEMDGFANNEGVIVLAATNRQDILDPALLRPGRFDREIYVGHPDVKGREAILRLHSKNKALDQSVNLEVVAKKTIGFTGAELENLLNEAALLAARVGKKSISNDDLHEATIKVIAGPAKKSKVVSDEERKLTAYHEAGHAVVIRNLQHHDPVHQITIVPRGKAGGMTISLPTNDHDYQSRNEMLDRITSYIGGRVAEKLFLDDISTGASGDIRGATAIARAMVTKYGMSEKIGFVNYASDNDEIFVGRDYNNKTTVSGRTTALIEEEIKAIIDNAYIRCEEILKKNETALVAIAEYLLEYETMEEEAFEKYFDTGVLPEKAAEKVQQIQAAEYKDNSKLQKAEIAGESLDNASVEAESNSFKSVGIEPENPLDKGASGEPEDE